VDVRDARPADAEAVGRVHLGAVDELGPDAYDEEQVVAWGRSSEPSDYAVDGDDNRFVVAERDGDVRGFGELTYSPGDYLDPADDDEVKAVYVRPTATRLGVGPALLEELERDAWENGFEMVGLWASRNAVPFYEQRGYERVVERTHEFGEEVEGTVAEYPERAVSRRLIGTAVSHFGMSVIRVAEHR